MYEQLIITNNVTDKKVDLDLNKLDLYINENKFLEAELAKINSFLSIINASDTGKKSKFEAKNNLISYFRVERNKNSNL
jgi:hypothetical protein